MPNFILRTEDILRSQLSKYFVETEQDRSIINSLLGQTPTILVGSRGMGKSFLLQCAAAKMSERFEIDKVLPVYLSFTKGSLIQTNDAQQFQHWMLSRICTSISRELEKTGMTASIPNNQFKEKIIQDKDTKKSLLDKVADKYEESWRNPNSFIDPSIIPSVDDFRDAIEHICQSLSINKICILMDEAAHVLLPEQQRQFFTLFRDLRCPYINCNAATYPGITCYGDVFQPSHDATMITLQRDVLSKNYIANMKEIVEKQCTLLKDKNMLEILNRQGENFTALAYAANGNPRILFKTLLIAPKLTSNEVDEVFRTYYRETIWSEHSSLGNTYRGHFPLLDWGRRFIEDIALNEINAKNDEVLHNPTQEQQTTAFIWVERRAPESVKSSLRLLDYTGIVSEESSGIRVQKKETGTRYLVNLGCVIAKNSAPRANALKIARNLYKKKVTVFGKKHPAYPSPEEEREFAFHQDPNIILEQKLKKSVDVLEIGDWLKSGLKSIGINTVLDVLNSSQEQLQTIPYVGEIRSRMIKNLASTIVFEYISG